MKKAIWNLLFFGLLSFSNLIAYYFDPSTTKLAGVLIPVMFFWGLRHIFIVSDRSILFVFMPFFILAIIDLVYLVQYNAQITAGLIGALAESDIREGYEFVKETPLKTLFTLVFYMILIILLFFFSDKSKKLHRSYLALSLLFVLLPVVDMVAKGASARSFPLGAVRAAFLYSRDSIVADELLNQRDGFKYNAKLSKDYATDIVFILGESSRRDYYSLYGASRKTNPELEKITPLAVFTDVISPSNATVSSLKSMLYMATVEDSRLFYQTNSIVSLAKEAGYMTYWLSSQARFGEFDATSVATGIDAEEKIFR